MAVAAIAAPALAQQQTGANAPSPQMDPRKPSVLSFETILSNAVELGAQRLAKRASEVMPAQVQMTLVPAGAPVVRGLPLEGYGYHFDVQIPEILGSQLAVVQALRRNPPFMPPVVPNPSGAPGGTVNASGNVVTPDPTAPSPANRSAMLNFDPNVVYTDLVREALVDAILDTGAVLVLSDGERLTVSASGEQSPMASSLERVSTRKLVLTMKGSDLNDLRAGRITRDQAKERIQQQAF